MGQLTNAQHQCNADVDELKRCRDLDHAKDEFISTVSHELRTPLTSIRGALGLLSSGLAGQVDVKAQRLIQIASNNTDRLVRLINDILDLQRMDSGHTLQVERVQASDAMNQAADSMRAMAETAGVHIEVAPEPRGAEVTFDGDPDRMQQVLCNLLSNAIKFSPQGAAVQMSCSVEGRDMLLRVEDRGRGVPEDKLGSIFDRFVQVEAADARQKGGSGLGLAICRAIVEQHGGSLWAESNDRNSSGTPGLTVTMKLPQTQRANDPMQVSQNRVLVMENGRTEQRARQQRLA